MRFDERIALQGIAILLLVVGVFAKTLRVLRLRAANPPTINWKIAIAVGVANISHACATLKLKSQFQDRSKHENLTFCNGLCIFF